MWPHAFWETKQPRCETSRHLTSQVLYHFEFTTLKTFINKFRNKVFNLLFTRCDSCTSELGLHQHALLTMPWIVL
ncbi:MAG: hypothetical protein F2551_01245, partial [Actinobacteria bacterium]|nr:hypothetical protein [Actinomycetota bacterium]